MTDLPYFSETKRLFEYVSQHDFDRLADLCDDDFGIIDIDPEGKSVAIVDRAGWEAWFRTLFQQLTDLRAHTYTDIRTYQALQTDRLGYSVVNFDQYLELPEQRLKFNCTATIIWKLTSQGWKESRWHCSLLHPPVRA